MRRLILLMLLTFALASSGCVAAVPLLIYAARNKQASTDLPPPAIDADAVRLASHEQLFAPPPRRSH